MRCELPAPHTQELFEPFSQHRRLAQVSLAARHARQLGLATVTGAPNVVRGGSHGGNVGALDLARSGLLDGLSSDYVPGSLLQAAWRLMHDDVGYSPPQAVALVSLNPARACGLHDRGAIAPGLRADLIPVHEVDGQPLVREAWRGGRRVI